MEEQDRSKPLSIDEILSEQKPEKPKFGRIPIPMGVGTGLGKEIKDMYKRKDSKYQDEIDD